MQMDREPELKKSSGAPLCRSVLFEQALGFAVLAVVSVLGTCRPFTTIKARIRLCGRWLPSMRRCFDTGPQEAIVFGRNELA